MFEKCPKCNANWIHSGFLLKCSNSCGLKKITTPVGNKYIYIRIGKFLISWFANNTTIFDCDYEINMLKTNNHLPFDLSVDRIEKLITLI